MIKLSVITVSYNNEDFIEKSIRSVLKFLPKDFEYIILDNGSEDDSVQKIKKYQKVKLIESKTNLGFSKGNNEATKKASGEYLFFLNPDTEIMMDIFTKLIEFCKTHPDAGIVAPKLVMSNEQTQPSVKRLPTVWGALKEYVLGLKNSYSQYVPEHSGPVEVEAVYGAAFLIKRDLFNRLQGFDERFFMYYEDSDLCKRVRKLGKKIYYCPDISVIHLVGATKSKADRYQMNLNSAKIYHGVIGALLLQLIFLIPRLRRRLSLG